MNYFVTAIDTDSGKTLVSALLCEALGADYWKPVQAGLPHDSDTIRSLITNSNTKIHNEAFILRTPASPHAAAKLEDITINLKSIKVPETSRDLIIEGAGGCMVPLNDHEFVIDMISFFNAHVILVADLYLGSINHTLLTIEALRNRHLPIKGIIFNGESNEESERMILLHSKLNCLLRIPKEKNITNSTLSTYVHQLKNNWHE